MAGTAYNSPCNYIEGVTYDIKGELQRVRLRALWPGLESLTEENPEWWRRRHPTRQIRFHIERPARNTAQGLRNFQSSDKRTGRIGEIATGPYGLKVYTNNTNVADRFYIAPTAARKTPLGDALVLLCPEMSEKTYELFEVELMCRTDYPFEWDGGLYYRYFMVSLAEWNEIDRSIRNLVLSFKGEGAGGDLVLRPQ